VLSIGTAVSIGPILLAVYLPKFDTIAADLSGRFHNLHLEHVHAPGATSRALMLSSRNRIDTYQLDPLRPTNPRSGSPFENATDRGEWVMQRTPRRTGFSQLELLAVVTILGLIGVIVIPRMTASSATSKQNACYQNRSEINSAVERYYFDQGSLPANVDALSAYFPQGVPICPVSLSVYTLDESTKRVSGHSTASNH